jgi:hypothetical protein
VKSNATGKLDPDLGRLIDRLPKVELHVHLEGTLEPELVFRLAARNGLALPFASVDEMRARYDFANLQAFLDIYYAACSVLVTREDFRELTLDYLHRAHADHVRHIEPFFDPQTHTDRGIPIGDVIGGILDGLADGEREFGITSGLILSFLRHLPAEEAEATLAAAEPRWGSRRSRSGPCLPLPAPGGCGPWPMPAKKGRRAWSRARSTAWASRGSTTAYGRPTIRRSCGAWRTTA